VIGSKAGVLIAGLACRCPACGKGGLFKSYLKLNEACPVCGFDLRKADPGDGAAVFVILIVGGIVAFLTLYLQLSLSPPVWVLLAVSLPLTVGLGLVLAPVFKSLLVTAQFHFRASEAKNSDTE
jgi:uncharacterized protein (DUF983 family)